MRELHLAELLGLHCCSQERCGDTPEFADVYQSLGRVPSSSTWCPTVLPGSRLWHFDRQRLLTGGLMAD